MVREHMMQIWLPGKDRLVALLVVLVGVGCRSKGDESGCLSFVSLFNHVEKMPRTFLLFWLK